MSAENTELESNVAENLAVPRTLTRAYDEFGVVFGKRALGTSLCVAGVAVAAVVLAFRDGDPNRFDLPVFIVAFVFSALLISLGVLTAILRKEPGPEDHSGTVREREAAARNSTVVREIVISTGMDPDRVLKLIANATTRHDLDREAESVYAYREDGRANALMGSIERDVDLVRIALGKEPLD